MKKFYLCIGILLSTMRLQATALTVEQLAALHPSNETLRVAFSESRVMPRLGKTTSYEGNLVYTGPRTLRMDYTTPAGDFIDITADHFKISRAGKLQSLPVRDAKSSGARLRESLLFCFQGRVAEIAARNEGELSISESGKTTVCTMQAGKGAHTQTWTAIYNTQTGALLSIRIEESNGNYTLYSIL